jgi:uncharacterized protein (DUF1697 family)
MSPSARPTHVALLRGINVGTAKRVAMADLRRWLGELGYGGVQTLLNSGNAVFAATGRSAPATHAVRIEGLLAQRLRFAVPVIVKPAAAIAATLAQNPLAQMADHDSRLMLSFTQDDSSLSELAALARQDWGQERLVLTPHAAWMWCPAGVIDSPLAKAAARRLGERVTTRNWATLQKIHTLLACP